MAQIACIVPNTQMVEHVSRLVEKNGLENVSVIQTKTAHVVAAAQEALLAGADIFLARGLQASILKATFDTPLVEIRLTGQEMGILVKQAKEMTSNAKPRIAVIGNHNMFCDMRSFNELYEIELREYFVTGLDQLGATTDRAIDDGADVVIGGEVVCLQAQKRQHPAIFLESGEESIAEALRMAASVAYTADMERKNSAEMQTLLDYSFNGIIMVDKLGQVLRMNHLAEKLLQTDETKGYGIQVSELIPELDGDMMQRVVQGEEIYSTLLRVKNTVVVANIAPVQDGKTVQSIILSFYERGRVEEMEEEIRRGLYHHGNTSSYTFDSIVGESKELRDIVSQAKHYAKFKVPLLITGEPGTEKELIAHCIHNDSVVSNGPFITLHCGSVPVDELDTVLFGAQKGSNDLQKGLLDMAEGGTLYIDEIGRLEQSTQYKLYKLIHKNTILRSGNTRPLPANVRIIAANGSSLVPLVKQGGFREDLFYALNVLNLDIPPLRRRKEDIICWINKYIEEMSQRYSRYIRITGSAYKLLADYEWDGNLPQIRSFCERVVILAPKRMVDEIFINEQLKYAYPIVRRNKEDKIIIYKDPKAAKLAELLEECGGNRTLVAQKMGISKSTLWRYMKKYSILE